jgi:HAD superfamily hydrolase (TIGR01509 family)
MRQWARSSKLGQPWIMSRKRIRLSSRTSLLRKVFLLQRGDVQPVLERRRLDPIRQLRSRNWGVAMVTSSTNCDTILHAAGISEHVNPRVDGNVAAAKGPASMPAPRTYEEADRMLGTSPECAVVVKDAISAVQAGCAGGFGLVIGVSRSEDSETLRQHGADIVVRDLAELCLV